MIFINTYMRLKSNKEISRLIKQHITMFENFNYVYLFGSLLDVNKVPNDIDILLIYSERSDNIIHDLNFICSILENECGLPVDFTVLSIEEERETNFLTRISSSYLKLK